VGRAFSQRCVFMPFRFSLCGLLRGSSDGDHASIPRVGNPQKLVGHGCLREEAQRPIGGLVEGLVQGRRQGAQHNSRTVRTPLQAAKTLTCRRWFTSAPVVLLSLIHSVRLRAVFALIVVVHFVSGARQRASRGHGYGAGSAHHRHRGGAGS
jgi:hypothetical protein